MLKCLGLGVLLGVLLINSPAFADADDKQKYNDDKWKYNACIVNNSSRHDVCSTLAATIITHLMNRLYEIEKLSTSVEIYSGISDLLAERLLYLTSNDVRNEIVRARQIADNLKKLEEFQKSQAQSAPAPYVPAPSVPQNLPAPSVPQNTIDLTFPMMMFGMYSIVKICSDNNIIYSQKHVDAIKGYIANFLDKAKMAQSDRDQAWSLSQTVIVKGITDNDCRTIGANIAVVLPGVFKDIGEKNPF